jgi:hypothetical protein
VIIVINKAMQITAASAFLFAATAVPAFAGSELNNCWGTVVSQRASHYHDVGEHSASQEEPRVGVGNLAHDVFNMSVGELASLLGDLDDVFGQDPDGVTSCH